MPHGHAALLQLRAIYYQDLFNATLGKNENKLMNNSGHGFPQPLIHMVSSFIIIDLI